MGKCGLPGARSNERPTMQSPLRGFRDTWLVALLACIWVSAGCAHQADSRYVYLRGTAPKPLVTVSGPGTYELFPENSATPKFSIDLAAGDKFGFRKREDDTIVAVARDKEIELGDRFVPSYYWVRKNAPQDK